MASCIKIETASLIYASLSVLINSLGSLVTGAYMVIIFISYAIVIKPEKKFDNIEIRLTSGLYLNMILSFFLAITIVALAFSIVLTKGLVSKKSHLVKAYFVYGVSMTTITMLFGLFITVCVTVNIGLPLMVGCFIYILILMMIRKTYLILAINEHNQCRHKKEDLEKSISIKL